MKVRSVGSSGVMKVGVLGDDVTLLCSAHSGGACRPCERALWVHFTNSTSLVPENLETKGAGVLRPRVAELRCRGQIYSSTHILTVLHCPQGEGFLF